MRKTFPKEERLCSKLLLDRLFKNGSSFVIYPFRIVFLPISEKLESPIQVVISVPKRKFKHAYQRNRIRRKIKETYRLQKAELLFEPRQDKTDALLIAVQYIAAEDLDYTTLYRGMTKALNKIVHEVR